MSCSVSQVEVPLEDPRRWANTVKRMKCWQGWRQNAGVVPKSAQGEKRAGNEVKQERLPNSSFCAGKNPVARAPALASLALIHFAVNM